MCSVFRLCVCCARSSRATQNQKVRSKMRNAARQPHTLSRWRARGRVLRATSQSLLRCGQACTVHSETRTTHTRFHWFLLKTRFLVSSPWVSCYGECRTLTGIAPHVMTVDKRAVLRSLSVLRQPGDRRARACSVESPCPAPRAADGRRTRVRSYDTISGRHDLANPA